MCGHVPLVKKPIIGFLDVGFQGHREGKGRNLNFVAMFDDGIER